MPLRHLYIGEFGYGNLGDDMAVRFMTEALKDNKVVCRSFSKLGDLSGEIFKTLIVGGGTLLDCRGSVWMRKLLELSTHAGRTALAGTGLDPGQPWTPRGRRILTGLLEGTRQGERLVRGPISVAMIKLATGIDCEVGLDPMVLFEPRLKPKGNDTILIVPGHQAKTVAGNLYHERMINVTGELVRLDWQVSFLPVWRRDIDLALLYSHEVGNGSLAETGTDFESIVGAMGNAHVVITDRLHAGLLALLLGRPALFMAHHVKAVDLCLALGWSHYLAPNNDEWPAAILEFVEQPSSIPMEKLGRYRKHFQGFIRRLGRD